MRLTPTKRSLGAALGGGALLIATCALGISTPSALMRPKVARAEYREVAMGLGPAGSLVSGYIAGILSVTAALGISGGIVIVLLVGILMLFNRKWYVA